MKKILWLFSLLGLMSCTQDEPIVPAEETTMPSEAVSPTRVSIAELENVVASLVKGNAGFKAEVRKKGMSRGNSDVAAVNGPSGQPMAYVVNFADNNGFVIVSALKTYYPVLAYSDTGSFDVNGELPPMAREWLTGITAVVDESLTQPADTIRKFQKIWNGFSLPNAIPAGVSAKPKSRYDDARLQGIFQDSVQAWYYRPGYELIWPGGSLTGDDAFDAAKWDEVKSGIWPEYEDEWERFSVGLRYTIASTTLSTPGNAITTKWGQRDPYNSVFPTVQGSEHALVGCGPVAIGQLMYFYRYPDSINWAKIDFNDNPDHPGLPYISEFLYKVAQGCHAKYYPDYTETKPDDEVNYLRSMGYTVTTYNGYDSKKSYPYPLIMQSEMKLKKTGETVKHSWLLCVGPSIWYEYRVGIWTFTDPYRLNEWWAEQSAWANTPMYYINWGWGMPGMENGQYVCTPNGYFSRPDVIHSDYTTNTIKNVISAKPGK